MEEEPSKYAVSSLDQRIQTPELFLYSEIIKSHVGEHANLITDLLINKGRLSLREIKQNLKFLSIKKIKSILVSLIQLRCVKYFNEVNFNNKSTLFYYFNEDGPNLWLYSGLIIQEVSEKFHNINNKNDNQLTSQIAVEVIKNILSLGSLNSNDLSSITKTLNIGQHELDEVLLKLFKLNYLIPISNIHYFPLIDLWNSLFNKNFQKIPNKPIISDLKKKNIAKNETKTEFLSILYKPIPELKDGENIIIIDQRTSLRKVNPTISFTINLNHFLKTRRSNQLVHLAKARIGQFPSIVYYYCLKLVEQNSSTILNPLLKTGLLEDLAENEAIQLDDQQDEYKSGLTFNALDVIKYLPKSLDLRNCLLTSISNRNTNKKKRSFPSDNSSSMNKKVKTENSGISSLEQSLLSSIPEEDIEELNDEDDNSDIDFDLEADNNSDDVHPVSVVNGLMKVLANYNDVPFLKELQPGTFYVPFSLVLPHLKSTIYDSIISTSLGPSALRIHRGIIDNRLATEKILSNTALMKEKDIRSTIGELVKYNAVEIQELPRTNDRAAARAVFLFKFNKKHSYDFIKKNITWNLANLLFKNESLKNENLTLLTKANREDVKGKELELLLPSEVNQLKMVNERELNVYTRLSRLLSIWEVFKFF